MAFGTCRWLSGSRGIWESLTVAAEPDLVLIMLQAPRLGGGVLDYLFSLLPERAEESRSRQALVEIDDAQDAHLSEKVLARGPLLARLRSTLERTRELGHRVEGLSCFSSSPRMAELAARLGVDLIDAEPRLLAWGTKAGSRQVFRMASIRHPAGSYHADKTFADLAETLNELTTRFGRGRWMVKADQGFGSGHGNAVLDTVGLPFPLTASTMIPALRPCTAGVTAVSYAERILSAGAIVEQVIIAGRDAALRYPSALGYLRRDQDGRIQATFLGVHDQVLGRSGDYIGCRFPADRSYRVLAADAGRKVLTQLAALGVTGHVGVDFVVAVAAASASTDEIYATEINLRQTGTTHPHRMVRAVRPGEWNSSGTLTDQSGHEVCYTGTDGIISPRYAGISSTTLIKGLRLAPRVAFNPLTRYGVIPHLWPSLERCGKIGATFIAGSPAGCDALERDFVTLLDELAHQRRDSGQP